MPASPDSPDQTDRLNAARIAVSQRDFTRAKQHLAQAVAPAQRFEATLLLAQIAEAERDWPAVLEAANELRAADPQASEPYRLLAHAFWELGDVRAAASAFEAFAHRTTPTATDLISLGRLYIYAFEYAAADQTLRLAERLDPANAEVLAAQASLAMILGDVDRARTCAERALRLHPQHVSALRVLTQISGGRLSQSEFAALRDLANRDDLSDDDRASVHFLLGDCLDARSEYDNAFAAYARAHAIAAPTPRYDPEAHVARTDRLIQLARNSAALPRLEPEPGPRPIFIVGMPRSGTTLIESVLGAHPHVRTFGERDSMRRIAHEAEAMIARGARLTVERLQAWRTAYFERLPPLAGAQAIVDKNPWNFDAVWLIARIFPNARIIHTQRNALEVGLSIYRHEFPRFMSFTKRLEDIGHYYGQYARLMQAVAQVSGAEVTSIRYDAFLADFATAAPRLVATCGLDWHEACGHYWTGSRPVATMSALQARQPPKSGDGRAAHYAAHLAPLAAALDRAGVDIATGALRGP